jgi:multisubunit Na+/H+ antiporter MnhC subunit
VSPFEYLFALVSILIGLAVADLSSSLHRLLRARQRVKWDWLALASALLVMMLILEFWWIFYGLGTSSAWTHYGAFLVLAATLVCMFLLASAALPDEVPAEGTDLRQYYQENGGYFWSLFSLFVLLMIAVELVAAGDPLPDAGVLWRTVLNLTLAAFLLSLATVRNRRYHTVVVLVLLVMLTVQWSQLRLA